MDSQNFLLFCRELPSMMTESEQIYLRQCKQLIEKSVGWGSHEHWTNHDFIRLSDLILNKTGVNLSTTTLKRIWGKVKYESVPQLATLDTLARFAGFPHWRAFKTECCAAPAVEEQKRDKRAIVRSAWMMLMIIIMGIIFLGLVLSRGAKQQAVHAIASRDFSFSGTPVTTGLPNTVIFDYDASAAPGDSVYIQPSGDPQQSTLVSKNEHQHTAIYYYPGPFQAKLMVNDQVVKQHEILIKTNGWLALVERNPIPLYFKEHIIHQGVLGIPLKTLESNYLDMQNNTPWVAYYNVKDFGNLQSDNFILETEVKNNFNRGDAVCQDSSLTILSTDAPPFVIPLAIPGCLANIDKTLEGKAMKTGQLNLLAFGTDFSDWVKIRCEAKDQQFRLFINRKLAYQGPLPQKTSKIAGIVYRFHGTGTVNYLSLSQGDGKRVYDEDFSG